jgi:hypothetical protein
MTARTDLDLELADEIKRFYAVPLVFVEFAYPWGEPGTELEHEAGPDDNQRQFLIDLGLRSLGAVIKCSRRKSAPGSK